MDSSGDDSQRLTVPVVSERRSSAAPARVSLLSNNSSIRIRRLTSATSRSDEIGTSHDSPAPRPVATADNNSDVGRRRSLSAPQRTNNLAVPGTDMSRVTTGERHSDMPVIDERSGEISPSPSVRTGNQLRATQTITASGRPRGLSDLHSGGSAIQATFGAGNAARANRGLTRRRSNTARSRLETTRTNEYDEDVLGLLDLVDPEVQTLGTLTNVQNSLFVPDLGRLLNRRPTYDLTSRPSTARTANAIQAISRSRSGTLRSRAGTASSAALQEMFEEASTTDSNQLGHRISISSQLTDRHWAVLPHGERLDGWTDEEIEELHDHVRHLLHSRREGFKRTWRGFKKYVSKPLGLFVFIYAVLITLFGATWVIFLIGWIYVGERQSYAVNVIDNVLVALFAVIGDGMAPFRLVDTYHMCFIAHYHHLTWRLRKQKALPKLQDHNDLPARQPSDFNADLEAAENTDDLVDKQEFSVLTPIQQKRLQYHQTKFSKSHTFYKPHETSTHHAFPLRLLVATVVLLDCHSLFQVALGTCTWSIDYTVRPEALTATILSCSITCNIVAGILVSIGDKRTRKKEVLDRLFRQALTKEAIEKMQRRATDHERENYEAIENAIAEESGEDVDFKDMDQHGRELPASQQSNDVPRITRTAPRVSKDMPGLSRDFADSENNTHGPITSTHTR